MVDRTLKSYYCYYSSAFEHAKLLFGCSNTKKTTFNSVSVLFLTCALHSFFFQDEVSSIVDRDEGDNSMGNEDIRGGRNPEASDLPLCAVLA